MTETMAGPNHWSDTMVRRLNALTLLVLAASATTAWGGSSVPDWVLEAANAKLPAYAAETKAVVLLDDRLLVVHQDGKPLERHREVIKILRPQGRSYAEIAAWYSKDEKLNSFHVWSISPDGHQFTVKDDQVTDVGADESGMLYIDERAKVVRAPGSDPGGIVAFETVEQVPNYMTETGWDFQRSIPVLRGVFEVDMPANWYYYSAWLRHDVLPPTLIEANHVRWELDDVPGIDLEDEWMAP